MFNRAIERVSGLSAIDRSVMWCIEYCKHYIETKAAFSNIYLTQEGILHHQRLEFQRTTAQQTQVHLMFGWSSVHRSYCSNIWTGWPELSSSVYPYYVHYVHRGTRPKVCYITVYFATDASQKWCIVLSLFRKC